MHTHTLLAQITNPILPRVIGTGDAKTSGGLAIGTIIGGLAGAIMLIAFLLAFIFFILGGISWITAGGDKNQLEAARNKITHAIIGLIIIASLWAIMVLLGTFLGINFPNIQIPTIENVTNSTAAPSGGTSTPFSGVN